MSAGRDGVRAKTLSHELEHGHHLLARHVELLDDLVDAEILEVLDDRGHRQARAFKHPDTAHLARDAFDGWTLGPVKRCPSQNSFLQTTANWSGRHAGSRCAPKPLQTSQPAVDLVPTGER
jgi:hypothetical protein